MSYDKINRDGSVVAAPVFTRRVLDTVPVLFQLAEWLLVIVAFQYVDSRFGSLAAKTVWLILAGALGIYVGTLVSNVAWRFFHEPFRNRWWLFFMYGVLPAASGTLVFLLFHIVVKQMVAAQS